MIKSPFQATYQDDLMREVIVVNFAGGGGSCVGIEQALGRPVDYAINHDPAAIAMHAVNHPLTTITAKPRHYLVNHHLCVLRKNMDGKGMDEPMPTITSKAAHHADVAVYLEKIDTTQDLGYWSKVRDLLNAYAGFDFKIADDEIIIIEINGEKYFISDIGMRMLEPRELALAMGMPSDYVIDIEPYIGKPYSKAKQIARIGNMVCAPVAEALVRANCADMAVDYAKKGGRADTMEELHRVFSGNRPRDRRPARVAV